MHRRELILALVVVILLWLVGSWYWYACHIQDTCEGYGLQSAYLRGAMYTSENQDDGYRDIPVDQRDSVNLIGGDSHAKKTQNKQHTLNVSCDSYIDSYIKLGADNHSADVVRLERFLNQSENENLVVDGYYSYADQQAVQRFQYKYAEEILDPWGMSVASGYVYTNTRRVINTLDCINKHNASGEIDISNYKF